MNSLRRVFGFILLLVVSGGIAAAQDVNGDGRITYLVPINVPDASPGALGSKWQTELWVYNGSDFPLNLQGVCPGILFQPACSLTPYHSVGVTEKAFSYETLNGAPVYSALVFSLYSWDANVVLKSRLYETSRHAQPAGVEIPVVREDQFFTKPSRFIGIPRTSGFRIALRVYDPMRIAGSAVRIELFDISGKSLSSSTVPLVPQTIDSISPGYAAILDLAGAFPQLADVDRFDIRVTPVVDGMYYWAFVSVTDQDTQTVLLVTADK